MESSSTATVVALFRCPGHRAPMEPVTAVWAEANWGLLGDAHARPDSSRQVLLMAQEILDALGLWPGAVRENITLQGLPLDQLRPGDRLQIGEAILEITKPCTPCARMDEIRPGLQETLRGRRGILARVLQSGWIRCGDPVRWVTMEDALNTNR